jgi:cytochrome c-type biogenesis protein
LGFSLLFTLLSGVMAGTMLLLGGINRIIQILSGIIVILLGLHTLFGLLPFLNYEKRLHPVRVRRGLSGAFFAGLAFGAGWTPCVGPILGSILLLAGQGGTLGTGVFYLGVYSAGLALPFIGAALIADLSLEGGLRKYLGVLNAHIPLFKRISGILLIIIGVFILSGRFSALSAALARLSQGY